VVWKIDCRYVIKDYYRDAANGDQSDEQYPAIPRHSILVFGGSTTWTYFRSCSPPDRVDTSLFLRKIELQEDMFKQPGAAMSTAPRFALTGG